MSGAAVQAREVALPGAGEAAPATIARPSDPATVAASLCASLEDSQRVSRPGRTRASGVGARGLSALLPPVLYWLRCSNRRSIWATTSISCAACPTRPFTLIYIDPPVQHREGAAPADPRDEPGRGRRSHRIRRPALPKRGRSAAASYLDRLRRLPGVHRASPARGSAAARRRTARSTSTSTTARRTTARCCSTRSSAASAS